MHRSFLLISPISISVLEADLTGGGTLSKGGGDTEQGWGDTLQRWVELMIFLYLWKDIVGYIKLQTSGGMRSNCR